MTRSPGPAHPFVTDLVIELAVLALMLAATVTRVVDLAIEICRGGLA